MQLTDAGAAALGASSTQLGARLYVIDFNFHLHNALLNQVLMAGTATSQDGLRLVNLDNCIKHVPRLIDETRHFASSMPGSTV